MEKLVGVSGEEVFSFWLNNEELLGSERKEGGGGEKEKEEEEVSTSSALFFCERDDVLDDRLDFVVGNRGGEDLRISEGAESTFVELVFAVKPCRFEPSSVWIELLFIIREDNSVIWGDLEDWVSREEADFEGEIWASIFKVARNIYIYILKSGGWSCRSSVWGGSPVACFGGGFLSLEIKCFVCFLCCLVFFLSFFISSQRILFFYLI